MKTNNLNEIIIAILFLCVLIAWPIVNFISAYYGQKEQIKEIEEIILNTDTTEQTQTNHTLLLNF